MPPKPNYDEPDEPETKYMEDDQPKKMSENKLPPIELKQRSTPYEQTLILLFLIGVGVGIIATNNIRSFRFTKKHIAAQAAKSAEYAADLEYYRNTISQLRQLGRTFSYYPGVGLFVDPVSTTPKYSL